MVLHTKLADMNRYPPASFPLALKNKLPESTASSTATETTPSL